MTNNERINNTSKKNQNTARAAAASAYARRDWCYSSIWAAYEKPSYNKEKAWHYCKEICAEMGGFDLLICSKNTFSFAAVFKFFDDDHNLCYGYITKDYDRFCRA